MHCFGLAVDIERDNNPFVGNSDKPTKKRPEGGPSVRIIEHATLLLGGAMRDPRHAPPSLSGHKSDSQADREARAARAAQQWTLLHADSEHVRRYLTMSAGELDAEVSRHLPALTAWKDDPPAGAPPWADRVTDAAWWRDQHALDVAQQKQGDFGRGKGSDPAKFGFMTLDEELVVALVRAGLTWGGAYATDKDIMHFDFRTGTIGGRPVL
jgi:hypothetical protein